MPTREDIRDMKNSVRVRVRVTPRYDHYEDEEEEAYQLAYWDIRRAVDTDFSDDELSSSGYWTTDEEDHVVDRAENEA
nr:hypothetical protein TetV2_00178 [Oceanusvirus sp.]